MQIKSFFQLSLAILAPILSTQCASSSVNPRQRAAIVGLNFAQPQVAADALQMPSNMSNKTAGTIGLVSGLTGGLVGAVVGVAVVSGVDKSYQSKHAVDHAGLKAPASYVQKQVQEGLSTALKQSPHYGSKLGKTGDHGLEVKVVSYGLQNLAGKEQHGPSILVDLSLKDQNSKVIYHRKFGASGDAVSPPAVAPPQSYLQQPALLEKDFQATANKLGQVIREAMDK